MTTFDKIGQFTEEGMFLFEQIMLERQPSDILQLNSPAHVYEIPGTTPFHALKFETRKEMTKAICKSFENLNILDYVENNPMWAWLTFVMRDNLFTKERNGRLKTGEIHTWLPGDPNDYQKSQRHKVRLPTILYHTMQDDCDHLLCGRPDTPGDLYSRLTSQREMLSREFQRLAKTLYFDPQTGRNKPRVIRNGPGTAQRLAVVRRQLNETWELGMFETEEFLKKLPAEFDKFLPSNANSS